MPRRSSPIPSLAAPSRPLPTKRTGRRLIRVLRVSRKAGREGDAFMAPQQQTDTTDDYVARSGDEIIDTVDETDSVSGGSVDREGLQGALRRCLAGEADGIIVANVRRFARTKRAGEAAIYDLIENKKSFVAVAERIDSAGGRLDRMAEQYLDTVLRSAQWEREDMTANWLDVRRRHVANGVAGHARYGYRKDEKTRRLVPIPAERKWVKFIFEKRAAGWSWTKIADDLNRRKVPPPAPVPRKKLADDEKEKEREPQKRATRWVNSRVREIVMSDVYLGRLTSGEFTNPKAHPPIVTADLWDKANNVRATSRHRQKEQAKTKSTYVRRPPHDYLLTGMIRCATCGGRMDGETRWVPPSTTHDGYSVPMYRCRVEQPWGRCPRPARADAEDLEKLVRKRFETEFVSTSVGERVEVDTQELDGALTALAAAESDLRAFINSDEMAITARDLGQEWFEGGVATRRQAVQAARNEVSKVKTARVGATLPDDLHERWGEYNTEQERQALSQVIAVIVVAPPAVKNARTPVAERCALWWVGATTIPTLPGVDGHPMQETPIKVLL